MARLKPELVKRAAWDVVLNELPEHRGKKETSHTTNEWEQFDEADIIQQSARLLSLPAEIRNKIWRSCLVFVPPSERNPTLVAPPNHGSTGLLRTCRQTRAEGRSIYFLDNDFKLEIQDFVMAPQPKHWLLSRVPEQNVSVRLNGPVSWKSFKAWFHRYRGGNVKGITTTTTTDDSLHVACGKAFDIVEALRDTPWWTVEVDLDAYRDGVHAGNGGWEIFEV